MSDVLRDRTLALAGVFQAAKLVQQAATTGRCDEAALETCINSVFNLSPKNAEAVYGSALCLSLGLQLISTHFDGRPAGHELDVTKYVLGVLYLEGKLAKDKQLLNRLAEGIDRAKGQLQHYPPTHPNVLANLADTYAQTISTLTPRIIVNGEQGFLTHPDIANKVRALLLAAIRSAVLWRQCGGSRLNLLFSRRKYVASAKAIHQTVHV
ncbi:MAG: hypothetical protein FD130_43 [Halothiobacillaceae bacterium]|nr:MAG: hypothetical protein FD130_43 [Halothiobacillaceae bacterium]